MERLESLNNKCSFCGTQSDTLKKCTRCGKAQYCGKSCQINHWKEHKVTCSSRSTLCLEVETQSLQVSSDVQPKQTQEAPPATESGNKKCSFCGTQSDTLKKCTRCGKAQYCGKSCQINHWKEHKVTCTPQSAVCLKVQTQSPQVSSDVNPQQTQGVDSATESGNKTCSFCGTQSDTLKKCTRCGKAQYCGKSCQTNHWKEHEVICTPQSLNHSPSQLKGKCI